MSADAAWRPAGSWDRLEREAAWCQMVRRIWPQAASAGPDDPTTGRIASRPASEPLPGRFGRFLVRHELGRGAFGVVSLAYDPRLRREVALKVPRAEVVVTPELRARFRREAMAAAGLDHPNIVPVYEAGEEGSVCLYRLGLLSRDHAGSLAAQRTAPVPPRMAAAARGHAGRGGRARPPARSPAPRLEAEQRPAGGARAGEPGGDGSELVPRITDFGLAKLLDPSPGTKPANPTLSGVIMGTPDYMAPEQAEGESRTSARRLTFIAWARSSTRC